MNASQLDERIEIRKAASLILESITGAYSLHEQVNAIPSSIVSNLIPSTYIEASTTHSLTLIGGDTSYSLAVKYNGKQFTILDTKTGKTCHLDKLYDVIWYCLRGKNLDDSELVKSLKIACGEK